MIGIITNAVCMMTTIALGIAILAFGLTEKEKEGIILGLLLIIVGFVAVVENLYDNNNNNQHIPAKPIAHNQNQTVFATDKDTYIADGLYPDDEYLLTVDGNEVLVVWQNIMIGDVG